MSFNIGLSGLFAANKALDVTGNNIANVATTGFKSSRVDFADEYAQSIRGTTGRTTTGSGVTTAAVSQQFTQGNLTTGTGRDLDLAINGNGFFMLNSNGDKLYTRAGAFHTDSNGFIVDDNGNNLQGYNVDGNGNVNTGQLANLRVDSSDLPPNPTGKISIASNLNSSDTVPTISPFDPTNPQSYNTPVHTDLYDTQGNKHSLDQYFVKTGTNTWSMYTLVDGRNITTPQTSPVVPGQDKVDLTFKADGTLDTTKTTSTGAVAVNADGTFSLTGWIPAAQVGTATPPVWAANGAAAKTGGVKIDMLATTQNNATSAVSSKSQDGYSTGQLSGLSIDQTGNLFASYTNGPGRVIGQLSLTNFANVQGLAPAGGTNWRETFTSGTPVTGAPTTGTLGNVNSQSLEDSNVDLTAELVNLIKAQSNYQANAKTISTQSTIMQTTIQMT